MMTRYENGTRELSQLRFRTPDEFSSLPTYGMQVTATMRANILLVLEMGTDAAVSEFLVDLVDAIGTVEEAKRFVTETVTTHNMRHGHFNYLEDRFGW